MYESAYGFLGSSNIIKYLFVLKLFTTVLISILPKNHADGDE